MTKSSLYDGEVMTDIAHIGIAVDNLDKAIEIYTELLGYGPSETAEVADQQVAVAIFSGDNCDQGAIELLAARGDSSPIKAFIDKHGPGLHHIAILVDDIESKLADLKHKGYRLIDETPRIGATGKKIAFIHPRSLSGVLVELRER